MNAVRPTVIATGVVLAIAFIGGVLFGPALTAEVAAQIPGGAYQTLANLQTKLQSGQTLAQIANATPNRSRDGLLKAIVDDASAKIDAAQKAGTITADQATQLKTDLQQRITNLVDNARPGPRR